MTDNTRRDTDVTIIIPPSSDADIPSLTSTLAQIVNTAYAEVESDIFLPSYERTNTAEIAQSIRDSQLAVAYLHGSKVPVGCVSIKVLSPERGEFGMLALDKQHQGTGLGRQLVKFAEDECRRRGCTIMQLEVLVPKTFQHASKVRMQAWYSRMEYKPVTLGNFSEDYPELAKILAGPTEYRIFEKSLV